MSEKTSTETNEDLNLSPTEADESTETPDAGGESQEHTPEDAPPQAQSTEHEQEPDTFPRDYVEKLRDESAKYRQRAQRADGLAQRLHTALVGATGRLQDPSDLPFEESHLDDPEALETAITDLLERKPHLASRKPLGDIGQGASEGHGIVNLAALMRSRA